MKNIILIELNTTNTTRNIHSMLSKKNVKKSQLTDNQKKYMLSHVNFGGLNIFINKIWYL